jgi:hypothetical protein
MRKGERGEQELGPRQAEERPAPRPNPETHHPTQMRLFPEIAAVPRLDPGRLRRIAYL